MPYEKVRDLTRQLLQAVETIHKIKICHRDLKPDNILISKDPLQNESLHLTLIDFGIGFDFRHGEPMIGKSGVKIWSAPETRSWTEYDEKCDLWSVGCLTTYMLTGKFPEKQFSTQDIIEEIRLKFYDIQDSYQLTNLLNKLLKHNST